jgi:hypothetical protein
MRWIAFDEGRRYIEIEPAVAVPDLDEPSAGDDPVAQQRDPDID